MTAIPEIRILLPQDRDLILAHAKEKLVKKVKNPMESEIQSWSARWRGEALEHYLPQGWSFGAFDDEGQMTGYILSQPILFFRGLTQTLWIENVAFHKDSEGQQLFETLYRWSRDKHLQCLIVENSEDNLRILEKWPNAKLIEGGLIEIRSARMSS